MSTSEQPFQLDRAGIGDAASLLVMDRDGEQSQIRVGGDAGKFLAESWGGTLAALRERELVPYSPDVVVRAGEDRAMVITDDLREESEFLESLLADLDPPLKGPREVAGQVYLYALVSETEIGRLAMVKKRNPAKQATSGRRVFLADDELRGISNMPWELDRLFDLVISERGGYVLNSFYFEQLFADAERLRTKIGPWVRGISDRLPMSQDSRELLEKACDESPRLRRRLRAIAHRGHLVGVELDDVARHVREMGLEEKSFVADGRLVVTEDNFGRLLEVLNEDLTRGGLTREAFRIESKEPLTG